MSVVAVSFLVYVLLWIVISLFNGLWLFTSFGLIASWLLTLGSWLSFRAVKRRFDKTERNWLLIVFYVIVCVFCVKTALGLIIQTINY